MCIYDLCHRGLWYFICLSVELEDAGLIFMKLNGSFWSGSLARVGYSQYFSFMLTLQEREFGTVKIMPYYAS